jgi:transposase
LQSARRFAISLLALSKSQPKRKEKSFIVDGALPVSRDLLSAGIELDADIEVERQHRMEALKAELCAMAAQGNFANAIDRMMGIVLGLEQDNERMSWRLLRALRYRFGRNTEKLAPGELKQLYLALGGDAAAPTPAGGPLVPVPTAPTEELNADGETTAPHTSKKRRKRKVGGATVVDDKVEKIVTKVPVPEEERTCALCGGAKTVFETVEHQRIEFVPAKVVLHIEQREKMTCLACRKDVSIAPRIQAPAVIRKVGSSFLAKLLADKCALCFPVDRQRRDFDRMGLHMPDKTLASYWAYGTDILSPVALSVTGGVFASHTVGADDSHLKTLDRTAKNGVFRAHLWCFVGTDGTVGGRETVAYGYTPSWNAEEIADWFSSIDGWIQCDGYAGYSSEVEDDDGETLVAVPDDRRLGCGMHIRSKFHAALLAKDRRAVIPLKFFADLYLIEAECKAAGADAKTRGEIRRERSLPILDQLDAWVDSTHPKLLPKSPLRRATTYAINQRPFFRRCFSDGAFEIDNGRTERRIRNYAVGRRNFLFTGSVRGGERLAVAYTLVDNCLILGIDPRRYLQDTIDKLERGHALSRMSELTPARWADNQSR